MEVRLTEEEARFVEDQVASGRYGAPHEVIADALRVLQGSAPLTAEERSRFEATLAEAEAEIEGGQGISGEQIIAELRALSHERRAKIA